MNSSGINPIEFRVLVAPDTTPAKLGSVWTPEAYRERADAGVTTGTVVAVSPLAFTYEAEIPLEAKPAPGDRVIFKKFGYAKCVGADGKDYFLINDKDVQAIISPEAKGDA